MKKQYNFSNMKKIKKLDFSKTKIVSAPTKKVNSLRKQIDIILEYLEQPESYVTDESSFDFFSYSGKKLNCISKKLGIKIDKSMLLVDVALKMKQNEKLHKK